MLRWSVGIRVGIRIGIWDLFLSDTQKSLNKQALVESLGPKVAKRRLKRGKGCENPLPWHFVSGE